MVSSVDETSYKCLTSIEGIPDELIEHIAFFCGTSTLLGPPSTLLTFITLNKRFHTVLSIRNNPHLYARIFVSKFDTAAPFRRFHALGISSSAIDYEEGGSAVVEGELTSTALAAELVWRCRVLKQIRAQSDFVNSASSAFSSETTVARENDPEIPTLDETLRTAYLMMLENDKKNILQLREHARIDIWLRTFWTDPRGWGAKQMSRQHWMKDDTRASLAMWLFWFFLDPVKCFEDVNNLKQTYGFVKPVALGAHKYPLSLLRWSSFIPENPHIHFGVPGTDSFSPFDPTQRQDVPSPNAVQQSIAYFRAPLKDIKPLPASVPAILTYLALRDYERHASARSTLGLEIGAENMQHLGFMVDLGVGEAGQAFVAFPHVRYSQEGKRRLRNRTHIVDTGTGSSRSTEGEDSPLRFIEDRRWDHEWARALPIDRSIADSYPSRTFRPGSLEGVWEGVFSYTEFTSYSALLSGGPPSLLQNNLVAQHSQTWRVREYHLLVDVPFSTRSHSFTTDSSNINLHPIPAGDPLHGFMPERAITKETVGGELAVEVPRENSLVPSRYTYSRYDSELVKEQDMRFVEGGVEYGKRLRDIVLTGEGHSSWGEFKLVGRVRRCDGLIVVSKTYTGGDRGRWLYYGYLVGVPSVGDSEGFLVGRWRDTISPVETYGYEGCFGMTSRR